LVNWKTVCTPKKYAGLGIKDLTLFGRALRLRWPWLAWDEMDWPWNGMPLPCEETDMQLFAACTQISVGNGQTANFWKDIWLNGMAPAELASLLYRLARRKSISVANAISNGRWLRDLSRISNEEEVHQFLQLWTKIDEVQLNDNSDAIKWLPCANGQYSAKSA
jgi:hypothetical protein